MNQRSVIALSAWLIKAAEAEIDRLDEGAPLKQWTFKHVAPGLIHIEQADGVSAVIRVEVEEKEEQS